MLRCQRRGPSLHKRTSGRKHQWARGGCGRPSRRQRCQWSGHGACRRDQHSSAGMRPSRQRQTRCFVSAGHFATVASQLTGRYGYPCQSSSYRVSGLGQLEIRPSHLSMAAILSPSRSISEASLRRTGTVSTDIPAAYMDVLSARWGAGMRVPQVVVNALRAALTAMSTSS